MNTVWCCCCWGNGENEDDDGGLDGDNHNDNDAKDIILLPMWILMINKICIYYKFQSIYVECRVINWDQKKEKINTLCTNCLAHTIQTPVINIAMVMSFTFSIRFWIRCDGISSNQRPQRWRWPFCSGMCQARRQTDWIDFYVGRCVQSEAGGGRTELCHVCSQPARQSVSHSRVGYEHLK